MTLQTTSFRGYSDFFTSGLRAVSSRVRRRPTSMYSPKPEYAHAIHTTTSSTKSHLDVRPRRSRTTSMIISQLPDVHEEKRRRRSSIVSFSSRLLDRMTSTQTKDSSARSSIQSRGSSKRNSRVMDLELPEVWITAGGPYTPTNQGVLSDVPFVFDTIDPFASSPDSKSIFIDLTDTPPEIAKHDSFLSLTSSSSGASFFHLPQLSRRERPVSIQTMPLPSRSRRSSYQYRISNDFLILEEHPPFIVDTLSEIHEEWNDPARDCDWRQFHSDLMGEDA